MLEEFRKLLTEKQLEEFISLTKPAKIQAFLNGIPYNTEDTNFSALRVMQERKAHCVEGALFAATALRFLGYPPIVVDLMPEPGTDDDHVVAIYKSNGGYGAIAKSNYWCLRYREAVYRNVRELVMSYFELYFNSKGIKELRAYTTPMNLEAYDHLEWMWSDQGVEKVYGILLKHRAIPVVTAQMIAELSDLDKLEYEAGMLGVNPDGLFKPKNV